MRKNFFTLASNHRLAIFIFIFFALNIIATGNYLNAADNFFAGSNGEGNIKSIAKTAQGLNHAGEYRKAIDTLNFFINNHEIDTLSTDYTLLLKILGSSYYEAVLQKEAVRCYALKIKILEELGAPADRIADADMHILKISANTNDYQRAVYHARRAIDAFKKSGDLNSLSITYSIIGDFFSKTMQFKIGVFFGELALESLKSSDDYSIPDRIILEGQLGSLYMAEDNKKGVEHYTNCYHLLTQIPDNEQNIGWAAARLGWALLTAKDYERAIEYLTIGKEKLKPIFGEESVSLAHLYLALGEVYIYLKEFDLAVEYLDKTYEIYYNESPDYYWLNVVYRMYGILNEDLGNTKEALLNFHKAQYFTIRGLPVNDDIFDFPDLDACRSHDVTRYILIKKTSLFRAMYKETGNKKYLTASNDFGAMHIDYVLNHCYKDFLSEYQMNQKMIDDVNGSLGFRMLNLRDLKSHKTYNDYLKATFNDLSFAKAYVLQSRVVQGRTYSGNEVNQLFNEVHSIQRKIDRLENSIRIMNIEDDERLELKHALASLYIDLFLKNQSLNEYEIYTEQEISGQMIADYLMETLDPNTVVLDYYITDATLNVFSLTNDNIAFYSSDIDSTFFDLLRNYSRALRTGSPMYDQHNQNLSSHLIDIIYEEIKDKERILVIPHRELFHVPFEGLMLPGDEGKVVENHKVIYNYSANLIDTAPQEINYSFTAFAPGFIDESNSFLSENIAVRSDTSYLSSGIHYRNGDLLVPIPFTIDEVKKIYSILEDKLSDHNIFIEFAANKENFIKSFSNEGIMHIATHGHTSSALPGLSGLFFSSDDSGNNSYLYMHELYDLQSNAGLVVLSACKTGTGVLLDTEGAFALTRGFLSAGAKNVIASLWKVHDENTKELMIRFYQHLADGNPYAQALRLAKLDCIDKGFMPMDWAGFVLIGNY